MKPRRPVCPSIVFCLSAVAHAYVRRFDLLGVFNGLGLPGPLPARLPMVVVFSLTDGAGEYDVELSVEHDQAEATLGRAQSRLSLRSPVVCVDEAVPLELAVSGYGAYTVKLRANGDLVGQRTFTLLPD